MNIKAGYIADPLIAPCGRVYSAAALKRLLSVIFSERVDDRPDIWKGDNYQGGQHENKRKSDSGRKRSGTPAAG